MPRYITLKLRLVLKDRAKPSRMRKRELVTKVCHAIADGLLRPINSDAHGISSVTVCLLRAPCKSAKARVHYRGDWGKTLCGKEGWNRHPWSSWEQPDSLKSTLNSREVTCPLCRAKLRSKKTRKVRK